MNEVTEAREYDPIRIMLATMHAVDKITGMRSVIRCLLIRCCLIRCFLMSSIDSQEGMRSDSGFKQPW